MKYTRIFPLILILTACAPVQADAPMVMAEASNQTAAPTLAPSATSSPEPTATVEPTKIPLPEGWTCYRRDEGDRRQTGGAE